MITTGVPGWTGRSSSVHLDRMVRVENPVHRGVFNVIIARKSDDNPGRNAGCWSCKGRIMTCTVPDEVVVWLAQRLEGGVREFLAQRLVNETPDLHQFLRLGFETRVKELLHLQGQLTDREIDESWYEVFLASIRRR